MTIRELFRRWCASRNAELSDLTVTDRVSTGEAIARVVGDRAAKGITPAMADDARAKMLEDLAPRTVAKHVSNAKGAWAWAVARGELKVNPWANVRVLVHERAAELPRVTHDDMTKVLAACKTPELRCLFALCRYAGLRRMEALALTWERVGKESLAIYPREGHRTTKQRPRMVPIVARLHAVLDEARTAGVEVGPCGRLRHVSDLGHILIRAVKDSGVDPWPRMLHALRAQCESDWLAAGLPVMDVCQWLGHSPQAAMRHYHAVQPSSVAALLALS